MAHLWGVVMALLDDGEKVGINSRFPRMEDMLIFALAYNGNAAEVDDGIPGS
jgi:hypothetical protein